jgi:hypothetical protein
LRIGRLRVPVSQCPRLAINFVIYGIGKIPASAIISVLFELFQFADLSLRPLPLLAA